MTDSLTVVNAESLATLYGEVPPLSEFRLRSINVDWRGPTITLRVDLSSFPSAPPPEWVGTDIDTVQCHLQFLAVSDLSLTEWKPPVHSASLDAQSLGEERRMRVRVTGVGVELRFTCNESVLAGHVSAFKIAADGTDGSRHLFSRRIDSLRHESIPETDEKTFHGRL
ncbi:Imm50 family immunity protein [Streptomyces sp. NPDC096030]|uniref:Imm50 family immunity protein n=1 Tax=Streptomyces sp. NPDC096030 TaxID=3155423 RepID=UPI0033259273